MKQSYKYILIIAHNDSANLVKQIAHKNLIFFVYYSW